MNVPRVSVVLPTRNGAATLSPLLGALRAQRYEPPIEIVAVDSGSTDATLEVLATRVDTLVRIPPASFDHALTRNLGIERARGEFVVLLVQDALPVSDTWVAALTEPLRRDPRLAGTFARQEPRPEATALARDYHRLWVASSSTAWTSTLSEGSRQFEGMTPADRLRLCTFDNVASCIRRSVWMDRPFRQTPIAEDLEWAREVLLAGHAIAFVPDALVIHSHDRSARYELARTRILHERLYDLFELETVPSMPLLLRAIGSSLVRHARCEWRHPSQWARAVALAVAWPLGQFLGAQQARSGRMRTRLTPGTV